MLLSMKTLRHCAAALLALLSVTSTMLANAAGETIEVFTKNQSNPYFQAVRLGADSAAQEMGVKVNHHVPTKPDSIPEQISQVEDVIVRKPTAVVFTPVDYKAMASAAQKMSSAGIPVVNIIDRLESGNAVAFVGAGDYTLALTTGRYLLKAMGGKGSVVILEGVKGSLVSADRVRGFRDAAKEFPDVKVLASQPANFQRLQAVQVMENLMQTFASFDGVMAANDSMATGAIEAMEGAGRKALVVGINGTKEGVDAVKSGKLLATGDHNPFLQGCIGTMAAVRYVRKQPIPKEFIFPPVVIDKSNYLSADAPLASRSCPKWEDVVKG
jgi:ribose transport system substrate-binding protein